MQSEHINWFVIGHLDPNVQNCAIKLVRNFYSIFNNKSPNNKGKYSYQEICNFKILTLLPSNLY
jgi:hypothetical protein